MTNTIVLRNMDLIELTNNELLSVDGGSLWGAFEVVCGVAAVTCLVVAAVVSDGAACTNKEYWYAASSATALIIKGFMDW